MKLRRAKIAKRGKDSDDVASTPGIFPAVICRKNDGTGAKEIHLSGMEENIKALADAIYADKVRRARALSVGERIDTAIELFEGALGLMGDGIQAQFPGKNEAEVESMLRWRLRRLRQVSEHGIYSKHPLNPS